MTGDPISHRCSPCACSFVQFPETSDESCTKNPPRRGHVPSASFPEYVSVWLLAEQVPPTGLRARIPCVERTIRHTSQNRPGSSKACPKRPLEVPPRRNRADSKVASQTKPCQGREERAQRRRRDAPRPDALFALCLPGETELKV